MSKPGRVLLRFSVLLAVISLCVPSLWAAQVVGMTTVSPPTVPVGVGTVVTVTAKIDDASLIVPSVSLHRLDAAGRVIGLLGTLGDTGTNGDVTAGDKTFTIRTTLFETAPTAVRLRVAASFLGKLTNAFSAVQTVTVAGTSVGIAISTPANLAFLNVSPVQVTGTVGDPAAQVSINGIPAVVAGGAFSASVPVLEGTNTLTAVATNANATTTTASVQVTLDTTPPNVAITTPAEQFTTTEPTIAVGGTVNDIVVGTVNDQQAQVAVNGLAAQVTNRSFLTSAVPLVLGPNTIQARAIDRAGNSKTVEIFVTRTAPDVAPTLQLVSGNAQTGPVDAVLPQPLVVVLHTAQGQPAGGVPVVFRVTQNSGGVITTGDPQGSVIVTTDGQGRAEARFKLGSRAGVGNNVVEATSTGYVGTPIFLATGTAVGASKIVVDTGNGQTGVVGQALPLPFIAIVTDAGFNRLGNVPVTFAVKQGGGTIGGLTTFSTTTDSDGRVAAVLLLGKQEGQDNNVVEATFAGNPGQPAAFLASAKVPGDPQQTRITGVVLDNSNHAIPAVTMRLFLTHHGTGLPQEVATPVQTNGQGQFSMPSPVGTFKLMADGSTAPGGPWPAIEFDITTVAGQVNDVGLPIYLPALDTVNKLCVTETTGGTLTLPQVPGFALTIAPGGATFPGGSRTGCVTVTPVNGDKVPMAPGFGQQPRFVVTIQPVGTVFNPPAMITLPNVDGLAPRSVTEMYSYDHDLAAFVAIGNGTVSADGAVIKSDPGAGVIKAGWHCGGNPNTVGSAGTCPTCQKCQGSQCVTDNSQTPPQTANNCKKEQCSGGAITTVNDDNDKDANSCCSAGNRLDKFGNSLATLTSQCPNRTQVTDAEKLHIIDGCSVPSILAILTPGLSVQDPVGGFFNVSGTSTAFGQNQGGTIPTASAALQLPCNQHDICYQTCGSTQASCDTGMYNRMVNVCTAAYPSATCPYSGTEAVLKCVVGNPLTGSNYFVERQQCFDWAATYKFGLDQFGGSAWEERQTQFCKCCQ